MSLPTVLAYCCSVWEVTLPWGRCGLCGERPTMTHDLYDVAAELGVTFEEDE